MRSRRAACRAPCRRKHHRTTSHRHLMRSRAGVRQTRCAEVRTPPGRPGSARSSTARVSCNTRSCANMSGSPRIRRASRASRLDGPAMISPQMRCRPNGGRWKRRRSLWGFPTRAERNDGSKRRGGAERNRTAGLCSAIAALSHLSYSPAPRPGPVCGRERRNSGAFSPMQPDRLRDARLACRIDGLGIANASSSAYPAFESLGGHSNDPRLEPEIPP